MDPSIGVRVKQIRCEAGLTQAEFASKLGISRDALNNIEHSRLKRSPESTYKLICVTFGVDYDWLISGQGRSSEDPDAVLLGRIDQILAGENETAKSLFRAFASFGEDEWKLIQNIIDEIKK